MNSIIIPVYNREDTVGRAVESALAQTWRDFELILVDDGSMDGSLEACRRWAEKDPRVRVVAAEHGGVSSARNHGIEAARGEWVSFLDSDDELDPRFLERLMDKQSETGADWVYCGRLICPVDSSGEPYTLLNWPHTQVFSGEELALLRHEILWHKTGNILFSTCMSIYRKSILDEHGLRFCENVSFGEDVLFNFAYSFCVQRFCYVPEALYRYCVSEGPRANMPAEDSIEQMRAAIVEFERIRTAAGAEGDPWYLKHMGQLFMRPFRYYLFHPQTHIDRTARKRAYAHFDELCQEEPLQGLWNACTPRLFEEAGKPDEAQLLDLIKQGKYRAARLFYLSGIAKRALAKRSGAIAKALRMRT